MPELSDTTISCGIRQLSGLCYNPNHFVGDDRIPPKQVLVQSFDEEFGVLTSYDSIRELRVSDITFGIVIFSDSIRRGNGKRLAAYIRRCKLGEVVASEVVNNPNTNRDIQMWTWYIDRQALSKWLNTHRGN